MASEFLSSSNCTSIEGDRRDQFSDNCTWYVGRDDRCGQYDTATFIAQALCCACNGGRQRGMSSGGLSFAGTCSSTEGATRDTSGDDCSWYGSVNHNVTCGDYDDSDFHAATFCCSCGGGRRSGFGDDLVTYSGISRESSSPPTLSPTSNSTSAPTSNPTSSPTACPTSNPPAAPMPMPSSSPSSFNGTVTVVLVDPCTSSAPTHLPTTWSSFAAQQPSPAIIYVHATAPPPPTTQPPGQSGSSEESTGTTVTSTSLVTVALMTTVALLPLV